MRGQHFLKLPTWCLFFTILNPIIDLLPGDESNSETDHVENSGRENEGPFLTPEKRTRVEESANIEVPDLTYAGSSTCSGNCFHKISKM